MFSANFSENSKTLLYKHTRFPPLSAVQIGTHAHSKVTTLETDTQMKTQEAHERVSTSYVYRAKNLLK